MNYFLVNRQKRTAVSLDAKLCLPRKMFPPVFPGKEQKVIQAVTSTENPVLNWNQDIRAEVLNRV